MERVLVTGLQGFTGRYLQTELESHGWEVVGLGQANLMDYASVQEVVQQVRPQAVVHLAAIAFVGHSHGKGSAGTDADDFYRINVIGTRHLLAALAALPPSLLPRSILLASSANVYGNATQGMLDESTPPQPANDYAVSKLAMEYMARLWMDKLPITVVRPFNYTGVGQSVDFLLPKIVAHYQHRAGVLELGNLDVWRDFSDVRAVVQAYRRLLEADQADTAGQTVNVCSGQTYSLREVLAMAEQISGHVLQVQVNPAFVRANEVKTLSGNPTRLRALIGADWQPPPLHDTLAWMLQQPTSPAS